MDYWYMWYSFSSTRFNYPHLCHHCIVVLMGNDMCITGMFRSNRSLKTSSKEKNVTVPAYDSWELWELQIGLYIKNTVSLERKDSVYNSSSIPKHQWSVTKQKFIRVYQENTQVTDQVLVQAICTPCWN